MTVPVVAVNFSNVRPCVRLSATVDKGDDADECAAQLKDAANRLCLELANRMIATMKGMDR